MTQQISWIGLGNMGLAMAQNLLKAGFPLTVYNRSIEKTKPLAEQGAVVVKNPAEAAQTADILITMLTDDAALEEVALGKEGFISHLPAGSIHLSMSTISPDIARRLAIAHEKRNTVYVAAPVFGKPEAAAAAKLWICTSGNEAAKEKVKPVLDCLGQGTYDFGEDSGAAHIVKLSGNFLIAAAIEAMAEAFTLVQKNNIDRTKVYELFSNTLFACPVYKNYGKLVAEQHYQPVGATPSLIRKDMGLVLQQAGKSIVPMPFAHIIFDHLSATVAKGMNDIDWAGFATQVSQNAGYK
jgi:3-hydroxyisobutyrate dehydrogenase-like beta-hydroxyacid dehydrogenase